MCGLKDAQIYVGGPAGPPTYICYYTQIPSIVYLIVTVVILDYLT